MWAVSPITPAPFLCRPATQTRRPSLRIHSRSAPSKNDAVHDQGKDMDAKERRPSGSDVLWALQRAAANKKKKTKPKKKKEVSSADIHTKDDDVDYVNVKPLCIKTEWASKLDELEKRLQEMSEFT